MQQANLTDLGSRRPRRAKGSKQGRDVNPLDCVASPGSGASTTALTFLTVTTKPSFRAEVEGRKGCKTAVAVARWINARADKRPSSVGTTAMMAA